MMDTKRKFVCKACGAELNFSDALDFIDALSSTMSLSDFYISPKCGIKIGWTESGGLGVGTQIVEVAPEWIGRKHSAHACEWCGVRTEKKKYCSASCRQAAYYRRKFPVIQREGKNTIFTNARKNKE